ncbi:MAG TPA: hypothetical protein VHS96_09490 [Bacteroidia bacterium]|nr:hypothetical protein [Bacteroidia bacterium]
MRKMLCFVAGCMLLGTGGLLAQNPQTGAKASPAPASGTAQVAPAAQGTRSTRIVAPGKPAFAPRANSAPAAAKVQVQPATPALKQDLPRQ